jgi:hypothetical protein
MCDGVIFAAFHGHERRIRSRHLIVRSPPVIIGQRARSYSCVVASNYAADCVAYLAIAATDIRFRQRRKLSPHSLSV